MKRLDTTLEGPVLVESVVHGDERGFFQETYRRSAFAELGIPVDFVQDNHSRSRLGIVRGMHFQPGMAKMVRCARGAILDVLVDIRRGSPGFGRWEAFRLDDENHRQLFCPDGFAHGFCVLSDVADVIYKTSIYYDPKAEAGFAYDDRTWPSAGRRSSSSSLRSATAPPDLSGRSLVRCRSCTSRRRVDGRRLPHQVDVVDRMDWRHHEQQPKPAGGDAEQVPVGLREDERTVRVGDDDRLARRQAELVSDRGQFRR